MEGTPQTNFSRWLNSKLNSQGLAVRKLARTMAERHPHGATHATIETNRRALYKYLREGAVPSRAMRAAIAEALGVSVEEIPEEDDELPPSRESANLAAAIDQLVNARVRALVQS